MVYHSSFCRVGSSFSMGSSVVLTNGGQTAGMPQVSFTETGLDRGVWMSSLEADPVSKAP